MLVLAAFTAPKGPVGTDILITFTMDEQLQNQNLPDIGLGRWANRGCDGPNALFV